MERADYVLLSRAVPSVTPPMLDCGLLVFIALEPNTKL